MDKQKVKPLVGSGPEQYVIGNCNKYFLYAFESMTIIDKLSTSLNRRDEVPNQELARQIAGNSDKDAIKVLFENVYNKTRGIQNDCIKVIYEIAALNPALIAGFADELITLLDSKNNRLQWGAMTALDAIANEAPKAIYPALGKIITVADHGSVITNDHCVGILIQLCAIETYAAGAFSLLNERLMISPTNQLPMYAEMALPVITGKNKTVFINTLTSRLGDIEKETKRLRVEKVIRKAGR